MILGFMIGALLVASPLQGPVVHATDVKGDTGDALTQSFADALRKALPGARHMRVETGDDADDLALVILFAVQPQGRRFDYAVDLMKAQESLPPERLLSLTGTCREDAIDTCAKGVIAQADRKAKE